MRYSHQREAIYKYLTNSTSHPTAEELLFQLKKTLPNIGQATVYRNLRLLAKNNKISVLHTKDGLEHFDGNISPHAHIICQRCGVILDIFLDKKQSKLLTEINDGCYELNYYGICDSCKNKIKGEKI